MGVLVLTKVVIVLMLAFLGSVLFSLIMIPILKENNITANISTYIWDGHKKKQGTPTMGGIIFIFTTLILSTILILRNKISFSSDITIVLFTLTFYSLIGFLDDYLSIKRGENEGLTSYQKLILQILVALGVFYLYLEAGGTTVFQVTALGISLDMSWVYGAFILFILVGASNAVNLTDGVDGLAGSLAFVSLISYALIALVVGKLDLTLFLMIFAGSILGFLMFNLHPARVFMGDVGSLPIGAVMGVVAILTHKEITLLLIAGVFVFETLTTILQLFWLTVFKKKLFLMTPYHHNLEKLGYKESSIVRIFLVISIVLALIGIYYGVWL